MSQTPALVGTSRKSVAKVLRSSLVVQVVSALVGVLVLPRGWMASAPTTTGYGRPWQLSSRSASSPNPVQYRNRQASCDRSRCGRPRGDARGSPTGRDSSRRHRNTAGDHWNPAGPSGCELRVQQRFGVTTRSADSVANRHGHSPGRRPRRQRVLQHPRRSPTTRLRHVERRRIAAGRSRRDRRRRRRWLRSLGAVHGSVHTADGELGGARHRRPSSCSRSPFPARPSASLCRDRLHHDAGDA